MPNVELNAEPPNVELRLFGRAGMLKWINRAMVRVTVWHSSHLAFRPYFHSSFRPFGILPPTRGLWLSQWVGGTFSDTVCGLQLH